MRQWVAWQINSSKTRDRKGKAREVGCGPLNRRDENRNWAENGQIDVSKNRITSIKKLSVDTGGTGIKKTTRAHKKSRGMSLRITDDGQTESQRRSNCPG